MEVFSLKDSYDKRTLRFDYSQYSGPTFHLLLTLTNFHNKKLR